MLVAVGMTFVIATGGIGGLFADSTNPGGCFGQGLALAAHAGAALSDIEFVQFHPTAFDGPSRPMPLLTEAIRGDGAVLIDENGERIMAGVTGGDLAPRDVVARAVFAARTASDDGAAYLDCSTIPVPPGLTRAEFLSLRNREFVQAGKTLGMKDLQLILGEILPNALPPVIVYASVVMAVAILLESALAFLRLSDPNVAS